MGRGRGAGAPRGTFARLGKKPMPGARRRGALPLTGVGRPRRGERRRRAQGSPGHRRRRREAPAAPRRPSRRRPCPWRISSDAWRACPRRATRRRNPRERGTRGKNRRANGGAPATPPIAAPPAKPPPSANDPAAFGPCSRGAPPPRPRDRPRRPCPCPRGETRGEEDAEGGSAPQRKAVDVRAVTLAELEAATNVVRRQRRPGDDRDRDHDRDRDRERRPFGVLGGVTGAAQIRGGRHHRHRSGGDGGGKKSQKRGRQTLTGVSRRDARADIFAGLLPWYRYWYTTRHRSSRVSSIIDVFRVRHHLLVSLRVVVLVPSRASHPRL